MDKPSRPLLSAEACCVSVTAEVIYNLDWNCLFPLFPFVQPPKLSLSELIDLYLTLSSWKISVLE